MPSDRPNILFIPPLGWLVSLILTFACARWLPLGLLPPWPWWPGILLGAGIVAFALYTNISGFRAFQRAGTNVNPYKPALTVVRDGAFRYTRNPMYLGMVLFTLGVGLIVSTVWGAIWSVVLLGALHFGVVLREEAYMEVKFGAPYRALLSATRRWL